jgi:hypothetical protein
MNTSCATCWRCGLPLPPNSYDCAYCRTHCWICQELLDTGGHCPKCSVITVTPNITWVCPKCGNFCQTYGFCPTCGQWTVPSVPAATPVKSPWRCPGCGRYHAPHVDTCPFCQPQRVAPNRPMYPYIGDPQPIYVGDPLPWTIIATTAGVGRSPECYIEVGDPSSTVSSGNVEAPSLTEMVIS